MPTPLTMYRTELNGYRENVMNAWKAYQEAIDALGDTQGTDYYKDGEQAAAATRDAAITAARSAAIEAEHVDGTHAGECQQNQNASNHGGRFASGTGVDNESRTARADAG